MHPGKPLLKYFAASELRAARQPEDGDPGGPRFLSPVEIEDIRGLAEEFSRSGDVLVPRGRLARKPHLRLFLSFLLALGAVRAEETARDHRFRSTGKLARHLPEILHVYLADSLTLIDNWGTSRTIPEDSLSAVEVVRQFELRRIELTRRSGRDVRPLAERPVAFAVFHALDEKGDDCFLFEINKDWGRLNLIGGKQEDSDRRDFTATVTREISEELGLAADRLSLVRLNDEPLQGYGLSGNAGSLAGYPCVLYGVRVEGPIRLGLENRWLTERRIRAFRDIPDGPLMVNPVYLDHLLAGAPSRLSRTPLSTQERVRAWEEETTGGGESPVRRWARVLKENKDLLAAVLTLFAALVTVAVAAFQG